MAIHRVAALVILSGGLLAGCGTKQNPDAAASINGEAITKHDLDIEMKNVPHAAAADPGARNEVLAQVINRKLLAQAAKDLKIDQSPDFAYAEHKAREVVLVTMLGEQLAGSNAKPNAAQIQQFIKQNPQKFDGRATLVLDQLRVSSDAANPAWLRPAKSIDDAARILTEHHVKFERGRANADTAAMPPELLKLLAEKPNEPFGFPSGNYLLISQVVARQPTPVPADQAARIASDLLKQVAYKTAIGAKLSEMRGKAQITYGSGFSPIGDTSVIGNSVG